MVCAMIWRNKHRRLQTSVHTQTWAIEYSPFELNSTITCRIHCEFGPAVLPYSADPLLITNYWAFDGKLMSASEWAQAHPLGEQFALLVILKHTVQ